MTAVVALPAVHHRRRTWEGPAPRHRTVTTVPGAFPGALSRCGEPGGDRGPDRDNPGRQASANTSPAMPGEMSDDGSPVDLGPRARWHTIPGAPLALEPAVAFPGGATPQLRARCLGKSVHRSPVAGRLDAPAIRRHSPRRRTSITLTPNRSSLVSSPCSAAWSASGPVSTVSTEASVELMSS